MALTCDPLVSASQVAGIPHRRAPPSPASFFLDNIKIGSFYQPHEGSPPCSWGSLSLSHPFHDIPAKGPLTLPFPKPLLRGSKCRSHYRVRRVHARLFAVLDNSVSWARNPREKRSLCQNWRVWVRGLKLPPWLTRRITVCFPTTLLTKRVIPIGHVSRVSRAQAEALVVCGADLQLSFTSSASEQRAGSLPLLPALVFTELLLEDTEISPRDPLCEKLLGSSPYVFMAVFTETYQMGKT